MVIISKPIVKWAQDNEHIYIRIDVIPDITDVINLSNNQFTFESSIHNLLVNFELLNNVNNGDIIVNRMHYYQLIIKKTRLDEYWSTLIKGYTQSDKNWLRIDWDKWKDEMDSDSEKLREIKFPQYSDISSEDLSIHSSESSSSE